MAIQPPKIGVVVLTFNSAQETLGCLEALRLAPGGERKLWVVDNASTDGSRELIPPRLQGGEVWLETGENLGYAGGNNAGIRAALEWGADYILILNPDCKVEAGFLPPLVRALEAVPQAGMVCPLILDRESGRIQSLGGEANLWTGRCVRRLHGRPAREADHAMWSKVAFPHGACVLARRALFEDIGLLNGAYFLYYEDVEFGLRGGREGWITLAIPHSRVTHGDTTHHGKANPVVVFHGTRNQAWVVAQYGKPLQRIVFLAISCYARWPFRVLTGALLGRFGAAAAAARGAWNGHTSKAWENGDHLAVPWRGRPVKLPELP
jgi:GT2 family glycosyltransferase